MPRATFGGVAPWNRRPEPTRSLSNFLAAVFALRAIGWTSDKIVSHASELLDVASGAERFWLQREAALIALTRGLVRASYRRAVAPKVASAAASRLMELVTAESFPSEPPLLRAQLVMSLCVVGRGDALPLAGEWARGDELVLRIAVARGLVDALATHRWLRRGVVLERSTGRERWGHRPLLPGRVQRGRRVPVQGRVRSGSRSEGRRHRLSVYARGDGGFGEGLGGRSAAGGSS